MTTYNGDPIFANGITLADDATPPQAGQINVALTALRDADVWLRAFIEGEFTTRMKRLTGELGASNWQPADVSRVTPTSNPWVNCIGASESRFVAAFEQDSAGVTQVAISSDGQGWRVLGQLTTAPGPVPRAIGILDVPGGSVNDCFIVIGGAYQNNSDLPGRWIRVMRPGSSGFTNATTGSLADNTNYGACAFAASKCFLFGGTVNLAGTAKVSGHEARIVVADQSTNLLTWSTPAGGLFAGGNELQLVDRWDVAAMNEIVVGMPIDFSAKETYVRCDGNTGAVATLTFPGGPSRSAGITVWNGAFWTARRHNSNAANQLSIYSSPDGVTWTLRSTILATAARAMVTCGNMLVAIAKPEPTLGGSLTTSTGAIYSYDGVTWTVAPTSFFTGDLSDHYACSTEKRSAWLTKPGIKYDDHRANFRISLGGVAF